jgi:hypothetical protein
MGTHLVGRELLARLGNVTLAHHDHESECCGFGGTFSLKHPDISTAMVSDKVASLKATGASQMVTADCGCMLNITQRAARGDQDAGAASLPGEHLATFLLRRTGGKQRMSARDRILAKLRGSQPATGPAPDLAALRAPRRGDPSPSAGPLPHRHRRLPRRSAFHRSRLARLLARLCADKQSAPLLYGDAAASAAWSRLRRHRCARGPARSKTSRPTCSTASTPASPRPAAPSPKPAA